MKPLVFEGVREHRKKRYLRGLGRSSTAPAHKNERGHIEGRGGPELEEEARDHFSVTNLNPHGFRPHCVPILTAGRHLRVLRE